MKVLVTSSRMPFALGMVRELAAAGHEVYAADDYERSPGSHSKYLAGHFVYPSPRERTDEFVAELGRIVAEAGIEVIVPAFEEAFYLAARGGDLAGKARVFTASFGALARLHDKAEFGRLLARPRAAGARDGGRDQLTRSCARRSRASTATSPAPSSRAGA